MKNEIQKAVFLAPELIQAIKVEAEEHHRTWMREVQTILEEYIREKQKYADQDIVKEVP